MKTMMIWIGLVLLPSMGWASDWSKSCDSTRTTTALQPGEFACYDPTANDDDSTILSVGNCENVDYFLFDDKDGDATVCTVAWEIEGCPVSNKTLSAAAEDLACEILSGTAALSGDDVESNIAGIYVRLKGDAAGSNAGDCRIMAKCAERAN